MYTNQLTQVGWRAGIMLAALTCAAIAAFLFTPLAAHAAAPNDFTSQTYSDADGDGTVDTMTVVINGGEALTACVVDATELASDWSYSGEDIGGSIASATCDTGTATITFTLTGTTANVTGHSTAPTIEYNNTDADNSIANGSGNLGAVAVSELTDAAAPVVVSVSPTDAATNVSRTSSIVVTFSEAMETTFDYGTEFSVTPSLSGLSFSDAWSSGDTVVTLTYTNGTLICVGTYNVVLDETEIDAASGSPTQLVTTGDEDGDWSFTTRSCSTTTGAEVDPVAISYDIDVTAPNGGEVLMPGQEYTITWDDNTVATVIGYVNISYSFNGGAYQSIEKNVVNAGMYTWKVPDMDGSILIKIEGTDLATVLTSDVSDAEAVIGTISDDEASSDNESTDTGTSYLPVGSLIKGQSYSAVYYVSANGVRQPFLNSATYFTWFEDFDDVITVTDTELASYALGGPMLPKVGVVLVKIDSLNEVYAITGENTLRWIASEAVAVELYGANWSDYIIDLPITMWTKFTVGEEVRGAGDLVVDRATLRTRAWLASH